jgi:1,4-alpha-glucan branching enzyme
MNFGEFFSGNSFDSYKWLGAHTNENGTTFRVYAPNADGVTIIGEFNNWENSEMHRTPDGNFWELYIEGAVSGQMYKYRIYKNGGCSERSDPYGFGTEPRPGFASIIRDMSKFVFDDGEWMMHRPTWHGDALNIYEVHLGSWKTAEDGKPFTYKQLAPKLVSYCKKNGYNCIEIMPLGEYPCDESWGYQATGFFSPTSRYGTADELKYLVNYCHKNKIAVMTDFVPVHFAVDGYALANFDGTPVFESGFKDIAYSEWGSCNFDFTHPIVCSFLKSAADYWLDEYHLDGLRMDAISRIIYWQGEPKRGENVCGTRFLKSMNAGLKGRHPSAVLCAEDSTDYPMVTKAVEEGGLGFDYKWDMGWMNDTLDYMQKTPEQRVNVYHKLTFSMLYNYSEKYILPLSHDENVHGKATIVQKMHGQYEDKFPQARALYMYMYAHPGKKLSFMGNELGQLREWDEKREQDWDVLTYPMHDSFHKFMAKLCKLYLAKPAMSRWDDSFDGFCWLDCNSALRRCYAMRRSCPEEAAIVAVFCFSDRLEENYTLNIGNGSKLKILLDSTDDIWSGCAPHYPKTLTADENGCVTFNVPRYSAAYYEYVPIAKKAK